jgi:hypothetical protein
MCALLAILAGNCGGGGGGSSGGTTPPPPSNVSITISPTSAKVGFGATDQFTASVTGSTNTAVTWSVKDSSGGTSGVGTISPSGLYAAPTATSVGAPAAAQTVSVTAGHTASGVNVSVPELNSVNSVTVTATSQADTTKSASATVTLSGLAILGMGPCTQSGNNLNCSAGVTGTEISRGQTVYILIVGYGIVPGTSYSISGSDVTIPQQPTSANNNFVTTTDNTPAVYFQISVSPTAALGPRNVEVRNPGGEISAFPGGLQITP